MKGTGQTPHSRIDQLTSKQFVHLRLLPKRIFLSCCCCCCCCCFVQFPVVAVGITKKLLTHTLLMQQRRSCTRKLKKAFRTWNSIFSFWSQYKQHLPCFFSVFGDFLNEMMLLIYKFWLPALTSKVIRLA